MKAALAIDIGTSSLKAALIDVSGSVLAHARVRFPHAKREVAHWTAAFDEAVTALARREPALVSRNAISAISISGNGPTLAAVRDAAFGPLLMWNEPEAGEQGPAASQQGAGEAHARTRSLFIPRIELYRSRYPEHYEHARWLLSGPEALAYALAGEAITALPDPRYHDVYWSEEELAAHGIDASVLPPFAPAGAVIGSCGRAPLEGVPVIVAGPDFLTALVGTGAVRPGLACDRAGTSEGLNLCMADRASHPLIRTLPAMIPNLWNASYVLPDTGARFHAWRESEGAGRAGARPREYDDIMREIAQSPIAPTGSAGECPGRAIVEDIGFSVRLGVDTLREAARFEGPYRLSGGQARNETWNRIKADITGVSFELTETADGELMGNAAIAFASLGEYASVAEAATRMVRVVRSFEPDARNHALYSEKYASWLEAGCPAERAGCPAGRAAQRNAEHADRRDDESAL